MRLAERRWPGRSPAIPLVHATGFCKETWEPFAGELAARGVDRELVAFDQRGHGDSSAPDPPFDWWHIGADVLAVAGPGPLPLGVGHSSGAAGLVLAELAAPGTFAALLLIEPIVFPPPFGRRESATLAAGALRRRASFPSAAAALENFNGRGPFAQWRPDALEAYVRGGLRREGDEWRLKCRPEVEAEFYRMATAHGAWDRLGELRPRVVVVGGEHSSSHPRWFLEDQAARIPGARVVIVAGASHFVPMERPDAVADLAAELLAGS